MIRMGGGGVNLSGTKKDYHSTRKHLKKTATHPRNTAARNIEEQETTLKRLSIEVYIYR